MPQYAPPRYTKDGRLRAPLHLVGPHRNRNRIAAGPAIFAAMIIGYAGKNIYDRYAEVTPQQKFLRRVGIAPYGVLGTMLSLQGSLVAVADPPGPHTVITDPAGLQYIRTKSAGAGGASGSIYNWLGLLGGPFPEAVRKTICGVCDAKYHAYGQAQEKKVIHVVGPDFREGRWSEREAAIELARAYRNVLHEFVMSGEKDLRLVPISGGVFSGPLYNQVPALTQQALASGFEQLHAFDKEALLRDGVNIELCIFMNREWDMFKTVFRELTPASKL